MTLCSAYLFFSHDTAPLDYPNQVLPYAHKNEKMNILLPCSILFLLIIADKTIFTLSFNFHLFIHLLIRLLNTLEIYTLITQITVGDSMPPLWGGGGRKSLVWPYADTRAYVKCTAALVK